MLRLISIQKRLLLAFGALALLLAATGLFSLQSMSEIRQRADLIEGNLLPAISKLGDVNLSITRIRVLTLRLLLTLDITQEGPTIQQIDDLRKQLDSSAEVYADTILLDAERKLFEQFTSKKLEYYQLQEEAIKLLQADEVGAATDLLDKINPISAQMTSYLLELSDLNNKAAADARTESIATYSSAKLAVIVLIVIAVVIALLIATVIARSISQPLSQAVMSAQYIADGDLTQPLTTEGNDELTQLSTALVQMQKKLRDAISHISSSSSQLASAAEQLNVVTDESA